MKKVSQVGRSSGQGKNPRSPEHETEVLPTAVIGGTSQDRSEDLQALTVVVAIYIYISVLWFLSRTARPQLCDPCACASDTNYTVLKQASFDWPYNKLSEAPMLKISACRPTLTPSSSPPQKKKHLQKLLI